MSTELDELMIQKPALFTQTREFRIFIEPYITTLRNNPDTEKIPVSSELKHLHSFSLESLLLSKGYSLEDIWIIQRMNGIECSHRLDNTKDHLLAPNRNQLENLKSVFKNKNSK